MTDLALSSLLPGCEAIWQETLALQDFDPAVLRHEQARNLRPAYGLTLVADYPLSQDVLAGINRLRQVCRETLGDKVQLYPDAHLHLTVYSLMRSRIEPLPKEKLAVLWPDWLHRLREVGAAAAPLSVPLRGLSITRKGAVMVCGARSESLSLLREQVARLPGVAASRDVPLHITIGQVRGTCGSAEAFDEAMSALRRHAAASVGVLRSTRLYLLYYRSRLLDQVIRSAVISLG